MIDGVELFQLRQRRSAGGELYFTGKLGTAAVVVIRDNIEPDLWKVIAGDPFRANARSTSPARALALPVDEGDFDDGDYDEGNGDVIDNDFDDIPEDVALPNPLGRR